MEATFLNFALNNGVGVFGMYLIFTLYVQKAKADNDIIRANTEAIQQIKILILKWCKK